MDANKYFQHDKHDAHLQLMRDVADEDGMACCIMAHDVSAPSHPAAPMRRCMPQPPPPPPGLSTAAKNACRRKHVLVGDQLGTTSTLLAGGERVSLLARTSIAKPLPPDHGPRLEAAWEDDHMALVIKPQGLPTQGGGDTLASRVKYCLQPSTAVGLLHRPQHVSGPLCAAGRVGAACRAGVEAQALLLACMALPAWECGSAASCRAAAVRLCPVLLVLLNAI